MPASAEKFNREKASDKPMLPLKGPGYWTNMLEDLEFMIETEKLNEIARLHNEGYRPMQISKCVKRFYPEVIIALVHLALEGKLEREIAYVK
ncbi:hypothetical protein [Terribacillus sp. JSM ZJ617]|uniref:hypothetical protein n=1 Tax=Terribacillus sp. JSM ZJ617 TaxID=3342119 RepID=UPI0035A90F0B